VFFAAAAAAQAPSEYEVKAAFLTKFGSFVAWPVDAPGDAACICVVGRDPFGAALEKVVEGRSLNGRPYRILRLKPGDSPAGCGIVFIGSSEQPRLASLLSGFEKAAVLTVGDVPGFCEKGGMINLTVESSRVRLQVNIEAAARSRLQLSSKLLALASVVRGARP
jgi:hypothetical protein